jgi:hypothetical protein
MTTPDIIKLYTERGWTFKQISYPVSWRPGSDIELAYEYQSPRMSAAALIHDGFTEDKLLIEESEYYTRQQHGTMIFSSINPVALDIIKQIACIYRLRDRGKQIPIPPSIKVDDVIVNIWSEEAGNKPKPNVYMTDERAARFIEEVRKLHSPDPQ